MGIPISAPIVHEEVNKTEFRANSFGAFLLDIIGLLSVLILPFVIGFSMGRFWLTLSTVVVPASVNYNLKYIVKASALDGTDYVWTSSSALQTMLQGDVRAMDPYFSYLSDDADSDGNPDRFVFTFMFPLRTSAPITAFHFVPEMRYQLTTDLFTLNMTSSPYVALSSADLVSYGGKSGVVVDGSIPFKQSQPVDSSRYTRYDIVYQRSYLDGITDVSDLIEAANIGRRYASRNQTSPFVADAIYATNDLTNFAPVVLPGVSADLTDLFSISITMRVLPARVDYVPSFAESLKGGWIQYFCIAYVIYWAYGIVRRIFVMQALVNTIAEVRVRR